MKTPEHNYTVKGNNYTQKDIQQCFSETILHVNNLHEFME